MNKQELLDKAVVQFGGKWPEHCVVYVYMSHRPEIENTAYYPFYVTNYKPEDYVCWHISEFQHRASELGYVNGYRWGVEYELDGKGPDLPDDTLIVWTDSVRSAETTCHGMNWVGVESFRITDQRYKPADTGYLDSVSEYTENNHEISAGLTGAECMDLAEEMFWQFDNLVSKTPENQRILFKQFLGAYHKRLVFAQNQRANDLLATDWYCYETQKALRLPPVGVECIVEYDTSKNLWFRANVYYKNENCIVGRWLEGPAECCLFDYNFSCKSFRPLDWNRKAEAERKLVVDAVREFWDSNKSDRLNDWFNAAYDAGYLRLPADKS